MLEIDCGELLRLVNEFHPDTKVVDLTAEEKERVFPEMRGGEVDREILKEPGGAIIYAGIMPFYTDPKTERTKLKNLYEENCSKRKDLRGDE